LISGGDRLHFDEESFLDQPIDHEKGICAVPQRSVQSEATIDMIASRMMTAP
jgi:hypothetical protein